VSVTGGAHRQNRQDLDGDGWIDMAAYERLTLRPRLFWTGAEGASAYVTLGAMREERDGGTLPGLTAPDGRPFPQTQDTDRFDAGVIAEVPVQGLRTLNLRGSAMQQNHRHIFGEVIEDDRHGTLFGEASLSGGTQATSLTIGIAYQVDSFRSRTFPAFDYTHRVPGFFGQLEQKVSPDLTVAASARIDFHSSYGNQFSPRLSALYRPGPWTVRVSVGRGFYAPTPFVEEIEAAGLSRLEPLGDLNAEEATTGSVDLGYTQGSIEARMSLFASTIDNATRLVDVASDRVRLVNADGTTRIRGSELLLRYRWNAVTLTGSYVFVNATEPGEGGPVRRRVPLTPRHTAGMVAMWEKHGRGRIGVEAYYTGRQLLDDNPYRSRSKPYLHLGVLGEVVLDKVSLFANAENILGVRQTRTDPLLRRVRAPSGEWTVDAWAPAEGFILNGGFRLRFGAED
jgi:iron complex outermembrane receptor protein